MQHYQKLPPNDESASSAKGEVDEKTEEIGSGSEPVVASSSKWKEKQDQHYGKQNRFIAVARLDALANQTLFPTQYDEVQIDKDELEKIIKEYTGKEPQYFVVNKKPVLCIKQDKILVADEVIGEGSQGTVWRAQDIKSKKWYAVKVPNKANVKLDDISEKNKLLKAIGTIDTEVDLIVITKIEKKALAVIPQEFEEGYTLETYYKEKILGRKLSLSDIYKCLTIFIGIIDQLEQIHKQGYMHHDLKPSNIQVNPHTGKVKIIDTESMPRSGCFGGLTTPGFCELLYWGKGFWDKDNEPPKSEWFMKNIYSKRPKADTFQYDIFSLGLIFGGMLQIFDFVLDEKKCWDHLPKSQLSCKVNNTRYVDLTSLNMVKEIATYIKHYMISEKPEDRNSCQLIKLRIQEWQQKCYEALIKDRSQFHKIGIVEYRHLFSGDGTLNKKMIPALQALDGFYLYMPQIQGTNKEVNKKIQDILKLCHDNKIPLRGIINKKPKAQQPTSKTQPGRKLPLYLENPLDEVCDQIDQIEKSSIPSSKQMPRPLNTYFYVTSENYDQKKEVSNTYSIGVLSTTSNKNKAYYEKEIKNQLQSRFVEDDDYNATLTNLEIRRKHFSDQKDATEKELETWKEQHPDKKNSDLEAKINLFQYEIDLTNSIADKIKDLKLNAKLTYQTLIDNLKAYRKSFIHSNLAKRFFCDILGLNHGTKSAKEIKKWEKELEAKTKVPQNK